MLSIINIVLVASSFGFSIAVPTDSAWKEDVVSYSGFQIWSAKPRNTDEHEFLGKIKRDYDLEAWKESRSTNIPMDLMIPPDFQAELKERLAETDIQYDVIIHDLQTAIDNENPNVTESGEDVDNRFSHKMDWTSYHRLDDIYGYLNYLADNYPQNVQLVSIGSSSEGRPLNVVRISSSLSDQSKPAIWIDGGIHAREWISPAVATYIIKQLVEVRENQNLLSDVDWYIMPVMNPDGYEYTHVSDRLWRKTRSLVTDSRCRGTDPNRNFGFMWGGKGTSRDPCSEVFHGSNAFSEPETRAVSNLISVKASQIEVYISLHSYGQYILIPWGYDVEYPPDFNELQALGNKAATKFSRYNYTIHNSAVLSPAAGGSDDWAKSVGIKYSYTVELPDKGATGFILPASQIMPVCQDFFPALQVFAEEIAKANV